MKLDDSFLTLFPEEDKVYEVLLSTKSNFTPIGVRRQGRVLKFRIFEGRSFRDLEECNYAIIQVVDDTELLAGLAYNLDVKFDVTQGIKVPIRRIEGYPWVEGEVKCRIVKVKDSIGESIAKDCTLTPIYIGIEKRVPRPISRADNVLLELAVLGTRLIVKKKRGLQIKDVAQKIEELYELYRKLGGKSEIAGKIMDILRKHYL